MGGAGQAEHEQAGGPARGGNELKHLDVEGAAVRPDGTGLQLGRDLHSPPDGTDEGANTALDFNGMTSESRPFLPNMIVAI
jgi:hypothetical protein